MNTAQRAYLPATAIAITLLSAAPGAADEPLRFMDREIVAESRRFLVRKSGNVRAEPSLRGKKIATVEKGERLDSPGRVAKTDWFALRRDGADLGFVHDMLLAPVIDGSLAEDRAGNVAWRGAHCRYRIHYEGRTMVMQAPIPTADYELRLKCRRDDTTVLMLGFMFLTETPFNESDAPLHQINVDLLGFDDLEIPPSVVMIWNRDTDEISVDSVMPQDFVRLPDPRAKPAGNLIDALGAAVDLAASAWTDAVWKHLAKTARR